MVRAYEARDLEQMTAVWNGIVEAGDAFPQMEPLSPTEAREFFASQSFTGVWEENGEILGLYILHPNNVGRCGHISNASFAVRPEARGKKIGERLVCHALEKARELGFGILQFNAVVATNAAAIRLYERLGFVRLGTIPKGFLKKDGMLEDIIVYYHEL